MAKIGSDGRKLDTRRAERPVDVGTRMARAFTLKAVVTAARPTALLMMVAAFGGYDFVMAAYNEAVKEKYRFGAYGDAMLII